MESRPLNLLDLPNEIHGHIAVQLKMHEVAAYALTSKSLHNVFQMDLAVNKLLHHVARGKQELAEKIIKETPSLLLKVGNVTDYSGRSFNNITVFQYALWALDSHMWNMILKYLPKGKAAKQLSTHLNKKEGYAAFHGNHYDFDPFIEALSLNPRKLYKEWVKNVGQLQRQVPAHVVNEYCRGDVHFSKKRDFHEKKLPRTLTFYSFKTHQEQNWFPLEKNHSLGIDYAISQGRVHLGLGWAGGSNQPGTVEDYENRGEGDLDAMIKLATARKKDLEALKYNLLHRNTGKNEDDQLNEIKKLLTILSKQIASSRFNFNAERKKIKLAFLQKVVAYKEKGIDLTTCIVLSKEEFSPNERSSITAGVFSNRVGNLINSILS